MLELVMAGGWPMIPLLLLSIVEVGIILERAWSLRRNNVAPPQLGNEVRAWVTQGTIQSKHIELLRQNSSLGMLLATTLDVRHQQVREYAGERIEDVGRHLIHGMQRYLNALGTIAAIGPLLGLFGTVIGMIQLFLGILDYGVGDINQLAGGIGKALICTATGMIVAVPALVFHRYFRGRIAQHAIDMEYEVMRLQDVLETKNKTNTTSA